jgi:hypothetical protein
MRLSVRVLAVFIGIALVSCIVTPVMGGVSTSVYDGAEGWGWMHQQPELSVWDWMNPQSEPIWDWMHPQSEPLWAWMKPESKPIWAWLNPQPEPPIWDWMKKPIP